MNSNEPITILKISPTLGTLADSYDGDKFLFGKEGKYKGWDAADAIESGFKTSDLESLIEGQSFFSMTELDDIFWYLQMKSLIIPDAWPKLQINQ